MELTPQIVTETFHGCLFKAEESTEHFVEARGVHTHVGFHPERIKACSSLIGDLLSLLPDSFKESGGGGMSFLNMCEINGGQLWTGDHAVMDQLVCLGLATDKLEFCAPREIWPLLPGGMPYILVKS